LNLPVRKKTKLEREEESCCVAWKNEIRKGTIIHSDTLKKQTKVLGTTVRHNLDRAVKQLPQNTTPPLKKKKGEIKDMTGTKTKVVKRGWTNCPEGLPFKLKGIKGEKFKKRGKGAKKIDKKPENRIKSKSSREVRVSEGPSL